MVRTGGDPKPTLHLSRRVGVALAVTLLAGALLASGRRSSLSASAAEPDPAALSDKPIVQGKRIFETKGCVGCHTIWEHGDTKRTGPALGDKTAAWSDAMRFAGALWNHLPVMDEQILARGMGRATFSPEEMGQLAAYLFFVKFVGPVGDVDRGRQVFTQGLCSRCHQFAGRGGVLAPRLDELRTFASTFLFARALWNHGPEMAAKMQKLGLRRPRLAGNDVSDVVAFIRGGAATPGELEMAYTQSGTPRVGESLFRRKGCIRCHAFTGAGGAIGPDLSQRPHLTVSEVAAAFWNHGAPMWAKMKELGMPFPLLSDQEMADLLAYLAFMQYAGRAGDPARGAEVFEAKSCSACHAIGGEKPKMVPARVLFDAAQSILYWTAAMWNHAPAMEQKLRETDRQWPRFEDDEMRDVIAFLRSRRPESTRGQ